MKIWRRKNLEGKKKDGEIIYNKEKELLKESEGKEKKKVYE